MTGARIRALSACPACAGHARFQGIIKVKTRIGGLLAALCLSTLAPSTHATSPEPAAHTAPALSPAQTAHLAALQARARAASLATQPMWRALLHYQVHPLTRVDRSLADDADFFLAPQGHRNAQAELDATLAAFFDPTPRHALSQPAACRFIARYRWLAQQLSFDPALLPEPVCERHDTWRAGLQADKVSLIFPSAYLNSPASMYGHTFLRLDPDTGGRPGAPMLSYAINYAANADESDGLAYALKGLTGLYAGQFTNAPYYLRLREYNDLENRDIWEYELALSREEIDRLLDHTWELGPTRFDYFFFDENCSYHLLALLEAARPNARLTERFTWWAIPVDTVRAVAQTPGWLRAVRYRPANSTELRHRARLLGPEAAGMARQLADGSVPATAVRESALPAPQQALVLETAERLVAYEATRHPRPDDVVQAQRMSLLMQRAQLPAGSPVNVPRPTDEPTTGHATARIDVMTGQRNGRGWLSFAVRPAYHDLLDPEAGYQSGSAIQFFQLELSREGSGPLRFERLTPVEITSLSAREPLLKAHSWRVGMHIQRSRFADADASRPVGGQVQGGPGAAWDLGEPGQAMAYVFLDNHLSWDRSLARKPWAAGTGIAAGLLAQMGPQVRVQAEAYRRVYLAGQPGEHGASLQARWHPDRQWALTVQASHAWREDAPTGARVLAVGVQRHW